MKKKQGHTTTKKCLGFDLDAPRRRRSKRMKHMQPRGKSFSTDDDGMLSEKRGEHMGDKLCVNQSQDDLSVVGEDSPIIGDNHENNPPHLDENHGNDLYNPEQPTQVKEHIVIDSTHPTQKSSLASNSPASHTRGALQRLAARDQNLENHEKPTTEISQDMNGNVNASEPIIPQFLRKSRGPTKMKIAVEEHNRIDITFNKCGQPIGENSIGMASFIGSLVREVVPITLKDWRKLSTSMKEILWTSIQSRYNVKEDWRRPYFFQKMGRLWRAGKSRIVSQIQKASNDEELLKLMPNNIPSIHDWMDFVEEKNSARFKARSERFKAMKKKQLPHTCSRKGYARLAEEMKKSCSDPSLVTRVALWAKAHSKKDGTPINLQVAETLKRIEQIEKERATSSTNVVDVAISRDLGPNRDHINAVGSEDTFSKLSAPSHRDDNYTKLEEKYKKLEEEMFEMKSMVSHLFKCQGQTSEHISNSANTRVVNEVATNPIESSPTSINNNNALRKCKLLDWCGSGEIVAEGRWSSNDPKVLVHHVPLGPLAVKVWVDLSIKPEAYLWRPNIEMTYIEDAIGSTVAWPFDKVRISG